MSKNDPQNSLILWHYQVQIYSAVIFLITFELFEMILRLLRLVQYLFWPL